MTLVFAIPSKGRLMEAAHDLFAKAGMTIVRSRGGRGYSGRIEGLDGAELQLLSASEIASRLADGDVHLGLTGEDLIRETIPDADARVHFVEPLGFGHADVVVATPKAWIDVETIADLDDVAARMLQAGHRMRVATKYVALTRAFFARHGLRDYRIVESLGATEGAPAAGTAEIIVDITSSGATLEANGLRVPSDGVMLESQANLVASLKADWSATARAAVADILIRLSAHRAAKTLVELKAEVPGADEVAEEMRDRFDADTPFGVSDVLVLHVPEARVYAAAAHLRASGAGAVSMMRLDAVFSPRTPVLEALEARLDETAKALR